LFFRGDPAILQTNWFIASVLTEILLLFSIRSMLPIEKAGLPAPIILWLTGIAAIGAVVLPLIPATAQLFSFTPPSGTHLALIIGLSLVYLVVTELVKRPLAHFLERRQSF
jgi:Mg2+-importing ATPase